MPQKTSTSFHSERPITAPENDELGRNDFAEQFAVAVRDHDGEESLVVALNGEWGSGKSSIWKLAHYALEKDQHAPRRSPPHDARPARAHFRRLVSPPVAATAARIWRKA